MASSSSKLRLPTLLLAALSIALNLAIIGTAGRTLNIFNTNRTENVYFLPIWNSHFDMRGLHGLIGTSTVIVVLNVVLAVVLFTSALPANALVLGSSALSTIISMTGLAFQATLNNKAPYRDTLQTWTCAWKNVQGEGVPESFDRLCHETRFAFFTTIPSFLIQLLLLALAFYALSTKSASAAQKRRSLMRLDEEEKDHELVQRQQQQQQRSFDSKADSARSTTPDDKETIRVLAGKR